MGRPKKEVSGVARLTPVSKSSSFTLKASFKAKDEEGNTIVCSFDSEGSDALQALKKMEFPKGINALVKLQVKKGNKELERALAPHKARKILQYKDVVEFEKTFKGL